MDGEFDPKKNEDQGAADDSQDWRFPDEPTDTSVLLLNGENIAPKDPYRYEKLPMTEHSGLPLQRADQKLQKPLSLRGET